MLICPVALVPCERPSCRGGSCHRAGVPALIICWECGGLEAEGVVHGRCVTCARAYLVDPAQDVE
jgi:hypothetical protein